MQRALEILLVLFLACSAVYGQSTYGSIVGSVTDPSGALIVGAGVTVTNVETNIAKVVNTGANGTYEATHLLPGKYKVRAESVGFQTAVRDGIEVESRAVVRIDFSMEVGSTTSEIQVTVAAPLIETETAQLADTRSSRQLSALPLLSNQNTFPYLLTFAGAQSVSINTYSFNGTRSAQTDIMMDGISTPRSTTPLGGTYNTNAMVEEIRLHAGNNSAEFQAPGVVSFVSKAGTNQLRGMGFYQHNNSALDARDFFAVNKPVYKTHTFGGTLGGPVYIPKVYNGHDRTFFMISVWAQRVPGTTLLTSTVPTPAMRSGDFSAFPAITDPITGQPFPNNQIPASRVSAVSQRVQDRFYPLPNFGDPNVLTTNNSRVLMGGRNIANRWEARIDQKVSSKNMLYARYSWNGAVQEPTETLPTIPVRNGYRRGTTLVISDAHTLGSSLVNEFRFGRQTSPNQVLGSLSGIEVLQYTGVQGLTPPGDYRGMPAFTFGGAVSDVTSTAHTNDRYHSWVLTDNVTWIRGSHSMKFGFDMMHTGSNGINLSVGTFGQFSFNGYFTQNAYADFLLGLPERTSRLTRRVYQDVGGYSPYFFFEDAWRVNPKVTLTLGVRYEYQFPAKDSEDLMFNLDPRNMSLVVPDQALSSGKINPLLPSTIRVAGASEAGYPQALRAADTNNFVPRIGVAIRASQRTVVRAGYGVFIDDFGFAVAPPSGGPLFGFTETFQNTNRRQPQYAFPNPFGVSGSIGTITATGFSRDLKNPYVQQWNFTVEREIANVGARLSYVGTKGTGLGYTRELNIPAPSTTPFNNSRRPYTQYGSLLFSENGGNSIYHALQADVERRFGQGLFFQANWTWSNLISDAADSRSDLGPTIENPLDRRRERGREAYAVRHRVNGSIIWELPFGRGRRYLTNLPAGLNHLAGGWTLSTLVFLETGRYFSASYSGRDISATGRTSGRPDCIANANLPPSERLVTRWFDASAFSVPAANSGRYGNCGVNTLEGPGLKAQHLGVTKRLYQQGERTNVEFQLHVLNLFNHPNFNTPSSNISNASTVAQVQSTRPLIEAASGRTMSALLRIRF
jgi:hypothetical protein